MSELNITLAENIARKKEEIFKILALAYCEYAVKKIETKEHLGCGFDAKDVAEAFCNDDRFVIQLNSKVKIKDPVTKMVNEEVQSVPFNVFRLFYDETLTVGYLIEKFPNEASYLLPLVKRSNSDEYSNGFLVDLKEFEPKKLFKKGNYKATLTKKQCFVDLEKFAAQELDQRGLSLKFIISEDIYFVPQDEKVLDNWDSKAEYSNDLKDQMDGYELLKRSSTNVSDNSSSYKTKEEAIKGIADYTFIQAIVFDKKLVK